jgi:hypothetical protein
MRGGDARIDGLILKLRLLSLEEKAIGRPELED